MVLTNGMAPVISFVWLGGEHGALALDHRYPQASSKLRKLLTSLRGAGNQGKDKRFSVLRKFNSVRGAAPQC